MKKHAIITVVILAITTLLFVRPGVFVNTQGSFMSPYGLVEIARQEISNSISGKPIPVDYANNLFNGITIERATRAGMTGQPIDYNNNENTLVECLAGLINWIVLIFVTFLTFKLKRPGYYTDKKALNSYIIMMWLCLFSTFLFSELTLLIFSFIYTPVAFLVAGIGSFFFYLHATKNQDAKIAEATAQGNDVEEMTIREDTVHADSGEKDNQDII